LREPQTDKYEERLRNMQFPFLFSPIKINQMELKNRIVMAGMHLHQNDDGYINDRMVQFFTRRAEGGVGLIIIGTCCIDSETSPPGIIIDDDRAIPGLKRLADSIKNCPGGYSRGIPHRLEDLIIPNRALTGVIANKY